MKKKDKFFEVSIRDNGQGFDMEEVKQTKQNHFGLKVMKERVELLGGMFHMKSLIGQGTTINFTIPNENLERNAEDEY